MFTWICPTCGREVPPAYNECPDCAARGVSGETAPAPVAPVYARPAVAAVAAVPPAAGVPHAGLPTWLMAIVFAFAFVGVGAGLYWIAHYFHGGNPAAASASIESVPVRAPVKAHPLQKYVEVTGIRFLQDAKKDTEARFVIINHSGADITDLAGAVSIWARTAKAEEEAAGTFAFKVPSLGPYESKEMTAPVSTKLKAYELPDWQFVTTQVQITSP